MMSKEEIRFRYKRNGCKRKHIKILAELNAVEPSTIEQILNEEITNDSLDLKNMGKSIMADQHKVSG